MKMMFIENPFFFLGLIDAIKRWLESFEAPMNWKRWTRNEHIHVHKHALHNIRLITHNINYVVNSIYRYVYLQGYFGYHKKSDQMLLKYTYTSKMD